MGKMSVDIVEQENMAMLQRPVLNAHVQRGITWTLLILFDYLAVVGANWLSYRLRSGVIPLYHPSFDIPDMYMFGIIPAAFLLFLHFDRISIRKLFFWQQAASLFRSSVYAMLLIVFILYFSGSAKEISRIYIFMAWLFSFSFLLVGRYGLKQLIISLDVLQTPVIMVGAGKTAELLVSAFEKDKGAGYKIVGLVEDNPDDCELAGSYPVLGTFDQLEAIARQSHVNHVMIAAPGLNREDLLHMIYQIQPFVEHITVVPDLFGIPVMNMELETLLQENTVLLKIQNNLLLMHNKIMKRVFDYAVSLIGLIAVVPVFLLISLAIWMSSPGPVIFAHYRIGYQGKLFPCYKFRTMVANSQEVLTKYLAENHEARKEWEADFKLKDDPRVTAVGRFLRKTSLDELPQFFNVLCGDMSLVGPRPIIEAEVAKYGDLIHDYYLVRPGITGIWQISGRNDIDYPQRVKMDSWYVRNWALWNDIMILCKTVLVVCRGKGAY